MCIRDRNGPIGGISVGLVDGEIVLMPDAAQREKSDLNLTVASIKTKICMIEAGANEVEDDLMPVSYTHLNMIILSSMMARRTIRRRFVKNAATTC